MSHESKSHLEKSLNSVLSLPLRKNVPLNDISRWRIGGPAKALVEPASANEVTAVLKVLAAYNEPFLVIGETSNILFDSRGFDGVLIKMSTHLSRCTIEGTRVLAEAGISVPQLVLATAKAGLSGIVHAAGIPGTLGGLVVMNGGTQRRGIGEHVTRVWLGDNTGETYIMCKADLQLSYRSSILKGKRIAVLKVELELEEGDPSALEEEISSTLADRAAKFPQDFPNCGSTFLSDPAMYEIVGPPGKAIEEAGLKGLQHGGAQVSLAHANFIVNKGNATDNDVLWLIAKIRQTVKNRTGFAMDCEVLHFSPSGELRPAHIVAEERWLDTVKNGDINA